MSIICTFRSFLLVLYSDLYRLLNTVTSCHPDITCVEHLF